MAVRQPIIAVVGHIDHGKTTLLDKIRGTTVAKREAGAITQHIGATEIPIDAVKKVVGKLLDALKIKLTIPGFLMIDTPGHAAFANLRKRGGSISDIAILVVDINEGFKAQTREALEVLRQNKVPFIIAANKVDLVPGWHVQNTSSVLESIKAQSDHVIQELDNRLYRLVIAMSDYGFESERFDRISDYTKNIAIVPCSGMTGEGVAELLMVITGLAQKYLESKLKIEVKGPGKGSIIEMKEEKGLGKTADVIIYDGSISQGDTIVVGGVNGPFITKVRTLLKPSPLRELREKGQFQIVKSVAAAAGIKVSAPKMDDAVAGMSLVVANTPEEQEKAKKKIAEEIGAVFVSTQNEGVILKTDSVGALEALNGLLRQIHLPIRRAGIGDLTKSDVVEAKQMREINPLIGVVFAFNIKIQKGVEDLARDNNIKIFSGNVVYTLFEEYQEWKYQQEAERRKQALEKLVWPAKIKLLKGCVFHQSNPCVVGVEVLAGRIRTKVRLIKKDGKEVGEIKELQSEGENVPLAEKGQQVAIAIPGVTAGRQIKEGDVLYSFMPKSHLEIIQSEFINELGAEEIKTIEEFKKITTKQ
jgi:translation initiation factor 5B